MRAVVGCVAAGALTAARPPKRSWRCGAHLMRHVVWAPVGGWTAIPASLGAQVWAVGAGYVVEDEDLVFWVGQSPFLSGQPGGRPGEGGFEEALVEGPGWEGHPGVWVAAKSRTRGGLGALARRDREGWAIAGVDLSEGARKAENLAVAPDVAVWAWEEGGFVFRQDPRRTVCVSHLDELSGALVPGRAELVMGPGGILLIGDGEGFFEVCGPKGSAWPLLPPVDASAPWELVGEVLVGFDEEGVVRAWSLSDGRSGEALPPDPPSLPLPQPLAAGATPVTGPVGVRYDAKAVVREPSGDLVATTRGGAVVRFRDR